MISKQLDHLQVNDSVIQQTDRAEDSGVAIKAAVSFMPSLFKLYDEFVMSDVSVLISAFYLYSGIYVDSYLVQIN